MLLLGKSQVVLDESVAGLRALGYEAEGTNDFTDVTGRFDVKKIDLVVFGGQVPADRKAELRDEIGACKPGVIFAKDWPASRASSSTRSGALSRRATKPRPRTRYRPDDRSIRLTLAYPADVKVTLWWQTSFVLPDPRSDSLLLLDDELSGGDHASPVPDHVPPKGRLRHRGDRRGDLRLQHRRE